MYKTINPKQLYTWSPPESPDTVFHFRAYAGPIIPPSSDPAEAIRYVVATYLNYCIVRVENIELLVSSKQSDGSFVDRVEEFGLWEGFPKVDWSLILPSEAQNALWIEISKVTKLTKAEERDLL